MDDQNTIFPNWRENGREKGAKVFHKNTHGRSFCTRFTHIVFVLYFFGCLFLFVFGLIATGCFLFSCILDFHTFFFFGVSSSLAFFFSLSPLTGRCFYFGFSFVLFLFLFLFLFFFFFGLSPLFSSSFLICYFNQFK